MSVHTNISAHTEGLAKAVHAALRDNLDVQYALGGTNDVPPRLYDAAPEDPVFPYLTYGAMRSEDISADGTPLASHQMTLHVWSRYTGRAEVLSLLTRVGAALTVEALNVGFDAASGLSARSSNPIYSDVLRAADGRTHHGLLRLSITTQHTGDTL